MTAAAALLLVAGCTSILGIGDIEPDDLALASLSVSEGELDPPFSPDVFAYAVSLPLVTSDIQISATVSRSDDRVTIAGTDVDETGGALDLALALGDSSVDIDVSSADGSTLSYSVSFSRGAGMRHESYLKANIAVAEDQFGSRVAMDGDTLVVAPRVGAALGAVQVYRRSGDDWVEDGVFAVPDNLCGANDDFGASLDVDGDIAAVSATGCDVGGFIDLGLALVFAREADGWTLDRNLTTSRMAADNLQFGIDVAIEGDSLVVASADGVVEVISSGNQAVNISTLEPTNLVAISGDVIALATQGFFGNPSLSIRDGELVTEIPVDSEITSISLDGDTLVVGLAGDSDGSSGVGGPDPNLPTRAESGAVLVFSNSEMMGWTEQAFIKASNSDSGDHFGTSVSIEGDILVVGAPQEAGGATGIAGDQGNNDVRAAGAAYLFVRNGASWSQQAYIKPTAVGTNDQFGHRVAVSASRIAVSARNEDSSATGIGGDAENNSANAAGAVFTFF